MIGESLSKHRERMAQKDGLEDTQPTASNGLGTQRYGLRQATHDFFWAARTLERSVPESELPKS